MHPKEHPPEASKAACLACEESFPMDHRAVGYPLRYPTLYGLAGRQVCICCSAHLSPSAAGGR